MYIIVMKIFALLLFMLCNVCINRGFNFLQQDLSWHSYVEGLKFLAELNLSVARDFFMRSHTLFPNLHSIQLVCAIDNVSVRGNHFDYMYDERITNKKDVLAAYDCIQRGISLSKEGQHTLATEEYIKGIVHNKYEAELWFHLGVSYAFLGQVMEAVQAYQNALHYNPIHIKSFLNMGTIFHELGDLHQAMKAYERVVAIFDSTKALQVEPYVLIDCLRVQANRVLIWYQVGEVSKAISISRAMLSGLPSIDAVHADQPEFRVLAELRDSFLAHILTMQRSVVVWNDTEVLLHRLLNITLSNVAMNKRGPLLPFDTLLYDIPLHQRLAISQITCRQYSAHVNTVRSVYQEDDSLVVGFVTVDIGNHPTGVLLDGLLRLLKLNKANAGQQVTTVVYNIGPISNTSLVRRSIISAADHFYDLPLIDSFLVKLKKLYGSHNLDVIVDMQVHTQGSQMELIAAHPPQVIAINYLVYPATSGCGFMNYLLADNIVSPSEHARQYAERLVMMPPSYQVAYYREYQSHEVGLEASTHLSFTLHSILESKADIRRFVFDFNHHNHS
ncbi:tetratricopeptide repeat protein [archaeon]|nr:MAG: tetratricopeptide repeat protein [archaeon]